MEKKLCLSSNNKILVGVCGGFAEYFKVDATLVRIIWVLIAAISWVVPIAILYIICWAIMPLNTNQ